ncbi:E3 ubiquitin-protein ligase UPL7-like isoform X1 [Zingiber officinale]|uniref:E3 ubiquitin-protein ligase UPL7-like isoform X1 n=1 Tax=Zingiber officinale TaxID=94328 RepID=UPI001C4D1E1A|nr:E3 ubiquitin-protein ligase UPL7-like isoform X1 [Zingiber officinale]
MSAPAKQRQVSLRGASAKEISRDALLEKLAHDRELRSYQRRASAAALFIQRVWRRYIVIKKVSEQLREEWEALADCYEDHMSGAWISNNLLRPFLFFVTHSPILWRCQIRNVKCITKCFGILLQSISSTDTQKNFCLLTVGTPQEKSAWLHQTQRLVSLCLFILADCSNSSHPDEMVTVAALSMRLLVSLTDVKGWKNFRTRDINDADLAVKRLIRYMTTNTNGIYSCFRKYILRNAPQSSSWRNTVSSLENNLLITASAITLCLRPFHSMMLNDRDTGRIDVYEASKKYCIYVMTVPYLTRYLPSILLPALKHEHVLLPCFSVLLTSEDKLFDEMLMLDQSDFATKEIPPLGWALANIVNLAIEDDDSGSYGCFIQGLDCKLYTHAVNRILEKFVPWLESNQHSLKWDVDEMLMTSDCIPISANSDKCSDIMFYFDLLKPVHQQWHLRKLLSLAKDSYGAPNGHLIKQTSDNQGSFKLQDVIYFYYYFLRIFSILNPANGALSILNVLSFTPGFIAEFWEAFECAIFGATVHMSHAVKQNKETILDQTEANSVTRQSRSMKESGHRWATVIQKISRRSNDESTASPRDIPQIPVESAADSYDSWDIEAMKHGAQGISKYLSCALFLFCSTYAHYLLVLDDIEFYEKQVPFTLQQQRKIAASLNTFVYNSLVHCANNYRSVIDIAVKCLNLLYERDCRHKFCPSCLWLAPARKGWIPVAAAARAHEAAFSNLQAVDVSTIPAVSSILTTVPHLYPFEERVQMFRELIKLDKVSRRMTGEVSEPGSSSIGIVVRRDHIIEDGYKQLNFLGPKLKSCINVSFISESGLPEAGLDYGGLSKEFLTDLSKAAFDPEFNLFSQTSTADSTLIPSMAARLLENGMELIEFLGRVVGKALYEGILLEYSFSLVFVQKLLGRYSFLDELSTLDSELYRNLMYVKHYEGDVTDLSLDFSVTEEICGKMIVTELKPGGRNISVRNENKLHYVHAMADYKLNRQILPFSNAFYRGMIDLISPSWLCLFNANEFNQLLSGGKNDFDVDDLRSNTKYSGGYSETSRTVKLFWEVVKGFKSDERCMLLKFVTSCSRAPLLGFKHLQPTFTIHKVACDIPLWATLGGQDVERLPSASTCYNTLKLPTYKRSSTLRNKLLYAISSNTGFELS